MNDSNFRADVDEFVSFLDASVSAIISVRRVLHIVCPDGQDPHKPGRMGGKFSVTDEGWNTCTKVGCAGADV